jgi:hypothetical protein
MSLTVISPLSWYWSSTTNSFSTRCWQDGFRIIQRGTDWDRDEIFSGHHFADGNVGAGFEAEVAVGEDADQLFVLGYGTPEMR